ncbi:hypothetical protein EVAR_58758_1 [Eumeta japonica]|uniref:Uncharacterized protein n=1 Tax=Eumeta variegata TaxID=151549 RepID=A0A4C1ZGR1_EUMVA|nr:hypothetical protein EVAR_58758_1 [Eumeta japonica]
MLGRAGGPRDGRPLPAGRRAVRGDTVGYVTQLEYDVTTQIPVVFVRFPAETLPGPELKAGTRLGLTVRSFDIGEYITCPPELSRGWKASSRSPPRSARGGGPKRFYITQYANQDDSRLKGKLKLNTDLFPRSRSRGGTRVVFWRRTHAVILTRKTHESAELSVMIHLRRVQENVYSRMRGSFGELTALGPCAARLLCWCTIEDELCRLFVPSKIPANTVVNRPPPPPDAVIERRVHDANDTNTQTTRTTSRGALTASDCAPGAAEGGRGPKAGPLVFFF